MIVYLAGPMTGYPRWNFDAFDEATARLRKRGFTVVSPAELDRARGFDPDAPVENFTKDDLYKVMKADLNLILHVVDTVVYLPGSEESEGASLEMSVARAIGKPVINFETALQLGAL